MQTLNSKLIRLYLVAVLSTIVVSFSNYLPKQNEYLLPTIGVLLLSCIFIISLKLQKQLKNGLKTIETHLDGNFEYINATVKKGNTWNDFVKNFSKNGDYYWVYASVYPLVRADGAISYLSCRRKATNNEIAQYTELYKTLKSKEK